MMHTTFGLALVVVTRAGAGMTGQSPDSNVRLR